MFLNGPIRRATARLWINKALNIHRGEETRVGAFLGLHILVSAVIGLVGTVVDSAVIAAESQPGGPALYATAALVLAAIALLYAGITDRIDKRRLFGHTMLVSAVLALIGAALLWVHEVRTPIPSLLGALFVWRFVMGIALLMVYWDIAPFYFDARQGKRLFPLLALGGAIGYSGGSIAVAGLSRVLPAGALLVGIAALLLICQGAFAVIRNAFQIIDAPRYRRTSVWKEVREGFGQMRSNAFLRAVGWNTLLFGALSGLIVFTYNAVITARTATLADAAGILGLQRALVTVVQAVILTKVMSQSALGGKHRGALLQQAFFLALGVAAFAVSMVGVADFTRQIEIALMSPTAIAAFAFLPSRYRGRVMVLNNLALTSAGIIVAALVVAVVAPVVEPLWFIYPIGLLLVGRMGFNVLLNRRYSALLNESLLSGNQLDVSRIEENIAEIIADELLLRRLLFRLEKQSSLVRGFVLGRLAKGAQTLSDIERLAPAFREVSGELHAQWIGALSRVAPLQHRAEISAAVRSPHASVRAAALLAEARIARQLGEDVPFRATIDKLNEAWNGPHVDAASIEILWQLEQETGLTLAHIAWDELTPPQRGALLEALARSPQPRLVPTIFTALAEPTLFEKAVGALQNASIVDHSQLRQEIRSRHTAQRLFMLQALGETYPDIIETEAIDLLRELIDRRAPVTELTAAALHVLTETYPIPREIVPLLRAEQERHKTVFAPLFALRYEFSGLAKHRYYPLLTKWVDERLHAVTVTVLTLAALTMEREEERVMAAAVCTELHQRLGPVSKAALEFVESKLSGEAKRLLLLHLEPLSPEEKHIRLKPFVRRVPHDLQAITTTLCQEAALACDDLTTALFASLIAAAQTPATA